MAFDITGINDYVKANEKLLLAKSTLRAKTATLINTMASVKGSAYLNTLEVDASLKAASMGWDPSGTQKLSRRLLTTGLMKSDNSLYDKDLVESFAEYEIKIATAPDNQKGVPFQEMFVNGIINSLQIKIEKATWQGDLDSLTPDLANFDGLIKIIGAEAGVVNATHSTPKSLVTDAKACIDAIVAAIPNEIIESDDLAIFAGQEVYRAYLAQLQAANLFHYTADFNPNMELVIPGTNVTLYGVAGLSGTKKAYASSRSNFYIGTDVVGDSGKFTVGYDSKTDEVYVKAVFNYGTQVHQPAMIVKYLGA